MHIWLNVGLLIFEKKYGKVEPVFDTEPAWVLLGFVVGLVIILAVAYAILRLSKRLLLKPFFTVTGLLLLLLLVFSLTGKEVRELQEAGVMMGATLLPWLPENLVLMALFDLFPTVETTLTQTFLSLITALTFAVSRWQGPRKPAVQPVATGRSLAGGIS
jgi:high-affinity Fe2+/Pb2+ permease